MFIPPETPRTAKAADADTRTQGVAASVALRRLATFAHRDDGSGFIEPELSQYVESLGSLVDRDPSVRVAAHTLLGEVLTGLEEDERVVKLLQSNIELADAYAAGQTRVGLGTVPIQPVCPVAAAAQTISIRLLRSIAKMGAVELRPALGRLLHDAPAQHTRPLKLALEMTIDILRASSLDAHPDAMVRVVYSFADKVLYSADAELIEYFSALEDIVAMKERALRFGKSEQEELGNL